MSYFNVSGRASGSIQIAHDGIWLSSNNVYSKGDTITKGETFLALTSKRYNSIIEENDPSVDRFNGEQYSLLRVKTPKTIAGTANPNEAVTVQWVQAVYGTSDLTFDIGDYVFHTDWIAKNNEQDDRIETNRTDIIALNERVTVVEINDAIQTTDITRLKELVDWDIKENEPQNSGLFECGLILYGGRAAGWE